MDIYTAQYRYAGIDRMNITVKSSVHPGNVFAPTWDMVKEYKDKTLTPWDYAVKYFSLLMNRAVHTDGTFRSALRDITTHHNQITLVCFCPAGEFCHRILAARLLENMGYGKYIGERQI